MKYDEFLEKLDEFRQRFVDAKGRQPESLDEFVSFVRARLLRRPVGGGAKSLKGLGI